MKKSILILCLISAMPLFAQTDRIDSLLNDLIYNNSDPLEMPEKPVKFDFIYAGLNYSSSSFYAGREIGNEMFGISGNLFYYNASGLFVGVSGNWYDQLTPAYSHTIISAGYSRSIDTKKLFTFRTSYSRFIYYKPDSDINYIYRNNFNLGLSFRKKWIGTRIGANLLFGDETKINFSGAVYSRINVVKLGNYSKIYTAPEISAFFSKETVNTTKTSTQNPDLTPDYEDVFSLLNTQIFIPVGLSLGNFDLELGYSLNFPTTRDANISYPVRNFFSFSFAYMLPMAR